MIGLGTNRLSASRLAGLREARQFRNGQWLEGEGSWFSPYSAAATAALKAAFSAAQWAIIRDYGWEHPEIVGYMNAYAVEDAKIAYSLVEGIGTRWIQGDGAAYIDTLVEVTDDITATLKIRNCQSNRQSVFGPTGGNQWLYSFMVAEDYWRYYPNGNGRWQLPLSSAPKEGVSEVYLSPTSMKINGYEATWQNDAGATAAGTYCLFKGYGGICLVDFAKAVVGSSRDMVPYKKNGAMGMIDLLTGTFYGNANSSGSFSESIESPAP